MVSRKIRFGVDISMDADKAIAEFSEIEGRASKTNMHETLLNRIGRIWKASPQKLIDLGLVKPEPDHEPPAGRA
jgi:hypothetical protein